MGGHPLVGLLQMKYISIGVLDSKGCEWVSMGKRLSGGKELIEDTVDD